MKVEIKVPSTTWFPVSYIKFLKSREMNCEEASISDTIVIEKTTPASVIIDPVIVDNIPLALSGPGR